MIRVRRVSPDEWDAVRAVRLQALKEAPLAFWATHEGESKEPESWWRAFIGAGDWFLAYSDDAAVGVAACLHAREGREAEVISVWVAPEARGQGVGRRLVNGAVDSVRARSERSVALEVAESNEPARALYERCGFAYIGEGAPLPHSPEQRQLRMLLTF